MNRGTNQEFGRKDTGMGWVGEQLWNLTEGHLQKDTWVRLTDKHTLNNAVCMFQNIRNQNIDFSNSEAILF